MAGVRTDGGKGKYCPSHCYGPYFNSRTSTSPWLVVGVQSFPLCCIYDFVAQSDAEYIVTEDTNVPPQLRKGRKTEFLCALLFLVGNYLLMPYARLL